MDVLSPSTASLMQLYVPEALKENEDPKLGNVAENSDVQIGFGL